MSEDNKLMISCLFGIAVGFAIGHWGVPPDDLKIITETVEVEVEKPMSEKYRSCARYAYEFQNPSFWTGELEDRVPSKEVIDLIDHCLQNQN